MQSIQVLAPEIADKVAAGEVIQRPVNVLKELLENSIDAGATSLQIDLEGGGRRLLRVTDNGSGIASADLELALTRQATSKIRQLEDFASLGTFGFRGEALHSIAAVSRFSIASKTVDMQQGVCLECEGGTGLGTKPSAVREGTCIEVRDLFFNLVARQKFLKGERYERALIVELVQDLALANPGVRFVLRNQTETLFESSGQGSIQDVLEGVFSPRVASGLLPMGPFRQPILKFEFEAYLSRPEYCRSDSRELKIFINGRIVRHKSVLRCLRVAYEAFQEKKRFPVGVAFLKIPPRMLDVNIHPQKLEVRIENEGLLEEFLFKSIRKSLIGADPVPGWKTPAADSASSLGLQQPSNSEKGVEPRSELPVLQQPLKSVAKSMPPVQSPPPSEQIGELQITFPQPPEKGPANRLQGFQLCGQLDLTFILGQLDSELLIVDQHIAQERVLFEEFYQALIQGLKLDSQRLLQPVTLPMHPCAAALAEEGRSLLENMGFDIRFEGDNLRILATPLQIKGGLDEEFVERVFQSLQGHGVGSQMEDYFRDIAASMACRGSIKAGDRLTTPVMQRLIEDLGKTANPFFCPHGRPVIVREPLAALHRRFERNRKS